MSKEMENKRCCIYARVSTDEQAERDLSIPFQLERCRYHAQGKGWRVVKEYIDAGESARTDKRPDFQRMISSARNKEFDIILVHKFDRFARNDYDFVVYEKELEDLKIVVESLSEPGDASTPAGYISRRMMQIISSWYSKNLAVEVKKGMQKKVENGGWPKPVTYGYKNVSDKTQSWIEVDPVNGPIVTEAFKEMATGKWTLQDWTEQAYSSGARSRRGTMIPKTVWSKIFHNRFYLGETWLKLGDTPIKGKHSPLIDEYTFYKVQDVLREHDKFRQRSHRHKYLLRGLLFSNDANSSCWAETHLQKQKSYYRSRNKKNGKDIYYNTKQVEDQLPDMFKQITISSEAAKQLKRDLVQWFNNENDSSGEIKKTEARLFKLEKMEKNLQQLMIEDQISMSDFKEHRNRIDAERSRLKNTADVISQRQNLIKADFEVALQMATELDYLFDKANEDERRLLCETVIKKLNIEKGTIVNMELNAPFALIASRANGSGAVKNGGAEGIRTPYLLTASQTLSQLSYSPATDD